MPQYGLGVDEITQKFIGIDNYHFLLDHNSTQNVERHKFFGPIAELGINLFVEITGLSQTHLQYYARHTAIWLFWLVTLLYFYKTSKLLVSHAPSALPATVLFACSPRLFAHAHYNSKDLVFLGLLLFAIYGLIRYQRTHVLRYILISAACIGIATSIRSVGAMFVLIFCIHLFSSSRSFAKLGIFVVVSIGSLYAVYPYLWLHPISGPAHIFLYANQNPWPWQVRFAGNWLQAGNGVWYYVPLAHVITTPIVSLLLFFVFVLRMFRQVIARSFNPEHWLLFNLFLIPFIYMLFAKPYVYNMGRHTLFFQLLIHLPLVYVVHAVWHNFIAKRLVQGAVAITGLSLLAWFGNEMVYFNAIKTSFFKPYSFELDYWNIGGVRAMKHLLKTYPNQELKVYASTDGEKISAQMLAPKCAKRLKFVGKEDAYFHIYFYRYKPIAVDTTTIKYFGAKNEPYLIINKLK